MDAERAKAKRKENECIQTNRLRCFALWGRGGDTVEVDTRI